MFNFAQGTTSGNPFWDKVRDFLSVPTQEEIDCQAPKPILINTGKLFSCYLRFALVSHCFYLGSSVIIETK